MSRYYNKNEKKAKETLLDIKTTQNNEKKVHP